MNKFIKTAKDLETTYEAKRAGFLEIALRKNKEALPYIDEAKALRARALGCKRPQQLLKDPLIRSPLAAAAGISTKASNFLEEKDTDGIVAEFISGYLEPAGGDFVEELVYRYLLSKGDALGGRMRNIVGAIAGEKLTRYIAAQLRNGKVSHSFRINGENSWREPSKVTQDEMISIKAIRWAISHTLSRELVYNIKVPVVGQRGNNIDVSIFRTQTTGISNSAGMKAFVTDPRNYLALGELKGGIDPAGADEHWKTANTALQRIRSSFADAGSAVETFFVGGAIESSMAEEIFKQYQEGDLGATANLTNENQLSELCSWIIRL